MRGRVLIYGATGYTGRLIAERLRNSRRHLIVAGRTPDRVQALAAELGVAGSAMAIDDAGALDSALDNVDVVINAASPFELTSPALIQSCLWWLSSNLLGKERACQIEKQFTHYFYIFSP